MILDIIIILYGIVVPSINSEEMNLINDVVEFTSPSFQSHHVTIFVKSSKELSFTSKKLLKQITSRFASFTFETGNISNENNDTQPLNPTEKKLLNQFDRQVIRIIIIDENSEMNAEGTLANFIRFMVDFIPTATRSKCLVFLITTRKNYNLLEFFKFAWMYKFLDVTVIEIILQNTNESLMALSASSSMKAMVHHYNPFNNFYEIKNFTFNVEIFVDKSKNLYRFPIQTGLKLFFPLVMRQENYTEDKIWDALYGIDVSIARILSAKLNFSLETGVLNSDHPDCRVADCPIRTVKRALQEERIDFFVDTFFYPGIFDDINIQTSIILYSASTHLVVRQYKSFEIVINWNVILTIISISLLIILCVFFMRHNNRNPRTWNFYKVLQILLGHSLLNVPDRIHHRIMVVTLSCISFTFTSIIIEQIFYNNLEQESYKKFNSLQDVMDAGITPTLTEVTKIVYEQQNNSVLQKLISVSKTIECDDWSYGTHKCIRMLINDYDNIQTCDVNKQLGKIVASIFSKNNNKNWIISFVPEPFLHGYNLIVFSKTSPYVAIFNRILRQLFESGIIDHLMLDALRNFTLNHNKFFRYEKNNYFYLERNVEQDYYNTDMVVSINKIVHYFGMAFLISGFILICEILWHNHELQILLFFCSVKHLLSLYCE